MKKLKQFTTKVVQFWVSLKTTKLFSNLKEYWFPCFIFFTAWMAFIIGNYPAGLWALAAGFGELNSKAKDKLIAAQKELIELLNSKK